MVKHEDFEHLFFQKIEKFNEANPYFERALSKKEDASTLSRYGGNLYRQGNFQKSRDVYETLLDKYGEKTSHVSFGYALLLDRGQF